MKKILAVFLAVLLLTAALAGCGAPASGPAAASGSQDAAEPAPVTIKWMHHFAEEARIAWAQDVAAKTHELYPWITVEIEVQPYDQYVALLKTKIQSDDAPDLYNLQARALLEEFVAADYCADLSDEPWLDTIVAAGVDAGRVNDGVYSIVQDMGGSFVFYNKAIFEQNGLKVPTTYSEWIHVLETLKDAGVTPLAAGYQEVWALLVDTYADSVPDLFENDPDWAVNKMKGESSFADDEVFAQSMQRIYVRTRYTQADAFGSDWNKACELVATGDAAMVIGGLFALDAIQSKNPEVQLGAFALPASENPADSRMPLGNPGGFIVYNGPRQEAAKLLLSVMLSKEMAGKYQTLARTLSTVKGIEGEVEPALQDILDVEADGRALSTSALAASFTGEYQKAYCTELVKFLMADQADVEGFAKTLDSEFAKIA